VEAFKYVIADMIQLKKYQVNVEFKHFKKEVQVRGRDCITVASFVLGLVSKLRDLKFPFWW